MQRVLSKTPFKKATHVIFDMDGLLLDTESLYTQATQNVVGRYGKTYEWSVKAHLMGLLGREVAQKLVELLDLPVTPEEYMELIQEQYDILMPTARLMPDTEGSYHRAIGEIAKSFGKIYTTEVRFKVVGTPEIDSVKIAISEMQLPITTDDFLQRFRKKAYGSLRNVAFMKGAERLVRHFHQHKVPIAVATSSSRDSFDLKTRQHKDFFRLFNHIVTGGSDPEVKHGKPSPDIFLVCASRFEDKPSPEDCLVFEDAPNGVSAANDANMQVVMVPDPHVPSELRGKATLELDSLNEMRPELFGLPALDQVYDVK